MTPFNAIINALLGQNSKDVGIGGSLINKLTGAGLTGAEQEANQFTSAEAEKARAWTEEMYNKYESPSAMMQQYEAAGLNPALMYGASSSPSSSFSSPSASSVSPSSGSGLSEIIGMVTNLSKLKADIANTEADTEMKLSAAGHNKADTKRIEELTPKQCAEIEANIKNLEAGISEKEAHARLLAAQKVLTEKQTDIVGKEFDWYDKLREVELKQRQAETARTEAERDLAYQQKRNLEKEIAEIAQRTLVYQANRGLLDEQTKNEAERRGLIVRTKREAGANADIAEFQAAHLTGDRAWRIAGQVVGELTEVAKAAGYIYGGAAIAGKASSALSTASSVADPITQTFF